MLSQSISSMESFASLAVVFTLHRLVSLSSVPELLPAMPPELWSPEITPAAEQPEISPDFSFTPAIPPTLLVPLTFPEKVHPGDIAGAASCDAADVFSAALGGYGPLYGEVLDERAALYIPESPE